MHTYLCPALNLTIKSLNQKFFDKGLLFVYIEELRNGYEIIELKETTSEGTEILVKKITTFKEFDFCYQILKLKIKKYEEKYNEKYFIGV